MKKVISVVGARPNFMKVAPIYHASKNANFQHLIVHTGQHYDYNLSDSFIAALDLPKPDYFLGVGSASHSRQTAMIMLEFEKVCEIVQPDLVIVVGDVNSTIACGLVAVKMGIKLAHVEAGLRSGDRSMPEEINRIATDAISDYFFVTEEDAIINLKNSGANDEQIYFVGNTMIDSLIRTLPKVDESQILSKLALKPKDYVLVTLHRPSNVDSKDSLLNFLEVFKAITKKTKVVFPIHPRTMQRIVDFGLKPLYEQLNGLIIIEPANYIDFLQLMRNSQMVLTDSGGIQEETTFLDIPCLTLRTTTERPVTITLGTNILIEPEKDLIINSFNYAFDNPMKRKEIPPLWDGRAAERIVQVISNKILC